MPYTAASMTNRAKSSADRPHTISFRCGDEEFLRADQLRGTFDSGQMSDGMRWLLVQPEVTDAIKRRLNETDAPERRWALMNETPPGKAQRGEVFRLWWAGADAGWLTTTMTGPIIHDGVWWAMPRPEHIRIDDIPDSPLLDASDVGLPADFPPELLPSTVGSYVYWRPAP